MTTHVRRDMSRERRQEPTVAKLPHRELVQVLHTAVTITVLGERTYSRMKHLCEPRILYAIQSLVVYSVLIKYQRSVRHWFDDQAKRAMKISLWDTETNFRVHSIDQTLGLL